MQMRNTSSSSRASKTFVWTADPDKIIAAARLAHQTLRADEKNRLRAECKIWRRLDVPQAGFNRPDSGWLGVRRPGCGVDGGSQQQLAWDREGRSARPTSAVSMIEQNNLGRFSPGSGGW
jgi:hypothetical protein